MYLSSVCMCNEAKKVACHDDDLQCENLQLWSFSPWQLVSFCCSPDYGVNLMRKKCIDDRTFLAQCAYMNWRSITSMPSISMSFSRTLLDLSSLLGVRSSTKCRDCFWGTGPDPLIGRLGSCLRTRALGGPAGPRRLMIKF